MLSNTCIYMCKCANVYVLSLMFSYKNGARLQKRLIIAILSLFLLQKRLIIAILSLFCKRALHVQMCMYLVLCLVTKMDIYKYMHTRINICIHIYTTDNIRTVFYCVAECIDYT